jgi:hypothetical protein
VSVSSVGKVSCQLDLVLNPAYTEGEGSKGRGRSITHCVSPPGPMGIQWIKKKALFFISSIMNLKEKWNNMTIAVDSC